MGCAVPHALHRRRHEGVVSVLYAWPPICLLITVMAAFLSDLQHSVRMLQKSPLFTSVAIASLALGLGANTAIFTVLDQALLRPLPVKNPRELVLITDPGPNRGSFNGDNSDRLFSRPFYIELRDRSQVFSGL